MNTPRVSFIVPVRNDAVRLQTCLRSILRNNHRPGDVELIVVDNGSTDRSAEVAAQLGARVIRVEQGRVAELRNRGAALATHGHPRLRRRRQRNRGGLGACGSRVPAHASRRRGRSALSRAAGRHLGAAHLRSPPRHARPARTRRTGSAAATSPCCATAFEAIGGFDTSLETCEDVDFCHRIRARGMRIVSDARLRSIHHGDPEDAARSLFQRALAGPRQPAGQLPSAVRVVSDSERAAADRSRCRTGCRDRRHPCAVLGGASRPAADGSRARQLRRGDVAASAARRVARAARAAPSACSRRSSSHRSSMSAARWRWYRARRIARCVRARRRQRHDPADSRAGAAQRPRHRRRSGEDDSARHRADRSAALRDHRLLPARRSAIRSSASTPRRPACRSTTSSSPRRIRSTCPFFRAFARLVREREHRHRSRPRLQDRRAGVAAGKSGTRDADGDRPRLDRTQPPRACASTTRWTSECSRDSPGSSPSRRDVRRELIGHGASADAVTTVLNGIDHTAFHRDRSREQAIRRQLGLAEDDIVDRRGRTSGAAEALRPAARGVCGAETRTTSSEADHRRRRQLPRGAAGPGHPPRPRRLVPAAGSPHRHRRPPSRLRPVRAILGLRGHAERGARGDGVRDARSSPPAPAAPRRLSGTASTG